MNDNTSPAHLANVPDDPEEFAIGDLRERINEFGNDPTDRMRYTEAPADVLHDNMRRAGHAAHTLVFFADNCVSAPPKPGGADGEPVETVIGDVLGDFMHLCDAVKVDFERVLERAYGDHAAELEGVL